jgi:Zn-finger nucleic acid-binding protein
MHQILVGQDPPVELERCRNEHGLWFDPGEMEKVIAGSAKGEEGAVARFFADLYGHDLRSESKGV